jgi:hypothetical protein
VSSSPPTSESPAAGAVASAADGSTGG